MNISITSRRNCLHFFEPFEKLHLKSRDIRCQHLVTNVFITQGAKVAMFLANAWQVQPKEHPRLPVKS